MPRLAALLAVSLSVALAVPLGARAQAGLVSTLGISRNFAAPLDASGTALWGTPLLSVTRDDGATWRQAALDSLRIGRYRVLSLDADGPTVWAGLYTFLDTGIDAIDRIRDAGFAVTTDNGTTFRRLPPLLDRTTDTVVVYGNSRIVTRVVTSVDTDRGLARPFGIAYDPDSAAVWVAGGYLGLRRSLDGGATWERIVLPPDNLDEIRPEGVYAFRLGPKTAGFPLGHFNHDVGAVLVDGRGIVWAGSARGLNRSLDYGASWRRFQPTGSAAALPSSFVGVLREQYADDPTRSAVWIATYQNPEVADAGRDGLVVTADGGQTFRQALSGETVFDLAFDGATVYAGTARGLLASTDGGTTWSRRRDLCDPGEGTAACRPDRPVYAVAVTGAGTTSATLWAGTADGLFESRDGGASWTVNRAVAGLTTTQGQRTTTVETFAYPNPFSPAGDRVVRVRFDATGSGAYTVRVFDFAMRLVRTLDADRTTGTAHEVLWDGTDADGLRVPNGPYFYTAEGEGRSVRGKILVVD
ncbi:MAG: hypothetical protein LCH53_11440 [Bacteroidetes bacterium]|nr:hypothetical protein [Bacteroidota bacterium]